jgi:hypothetical protein
MDKGILKFSDYYFGYELGYKYIKEEHYDVNFFALSIKEEEKFVLW